MSVALLISKTNRTLRVLYVSLRYTHTHTHYDCGLPRSRIEQVQVECRPAVGGLYNIRCDQILAHPLASEWLDPLSAS